MQTFTQFLDIGMDLLSKQIFTSLVIVYIYLQQGSRQLWAGVTQQALLTVVRPY